MPVAVAMEPVLDWVPQSLHVMFWSPAVPSAQASKRDDGWTFAAGGFWVQSATLTVVPLEDTPEPEEPVVLEPAPVPGDEATGAREPPRRPHRSSESMNLLSCRSFTLV